MAIHLNKNDLKQLINETVQRKMRALTENLKRHSDEPNEDTKYYKRLETDPIGDELTVEEIEIKDTIKEMVLNKIANNPTAYGFSTI